MGNPELNLKEPDQALMWLKAFEARARVEKKRDIDATPGTSGPPTVAAIAKDYQVTEFFMSQGGLEALIKLSSLVAPRNIEDMKFIDFGKDLINYLKPQERLVVAERTGFLQMSQGGEEAETDYLARLRDAARYCKFVDLKASPDPEAEPIRLQFIAGQRDSESKLKLLEALRANDNLTVGDLLQRIQYRTQANRFAESSIHQSTSSVVAYAKNVAPIIKKDLSRRQKPEQCGRCGRKPFHLLYECPAKDEKCNNCSKQGHYSRMCKAKRQEASRTEGKTYRKSNASVHHICEEQEFEDPASSEETMYYVEQIATVKIVHHIGSKAEFHSIKINGRDIRMQNDTGSSVTKILTKIWREIGSPTLSTIARWFEAYDGHRMLYLGPLKCEIPWEKKTHSVDVAVIECEKEFGLIGRDVTRVDHIHNASLSDVKSLACN